MDRGNSSVLDIRPLMWKDGWPVGCDNFKEGTYQIQSVRTGTALELAVEGVAVGGGRGGRGGGAGGRGGAGFGGTRGERGNTGTREGGGRGAAPGGRGGTRGAIPGAGNFAGAIGGGERGAAGGRRGAGGFGAGAFGGRGGGDAGAARGGAGGMFGGRGGGSGNPVPDQNAADVSANWPEGNIDIRLSNYMCQAQQKWTITPAEGAGGYLGSPYFKITIAGTDRALAVGEDGELVSLPAFTGGHEQLWRIDLLTDGTWRVMPKFASIAGESLALSAIGSSFATLEKFDPDSDKQRWLFKNP